jgi:hypothetical protein
VTTGWIGVGLLHWMLCAPMEPPSSDLFLSISRPIAPFPNIPFVVRHPQGTEIKAITYSNMQIHEKEERADVYVIVDI